MMTLVFSDFSEPTFNKYDDSCFLRFLSQFSVLDPYIVVSQTSAKPGNGVSTSVGSSPTNRCKNVYFSLHAGTPNKKIGTLLQEMNKQLMHVKNDVSIIKARNILCKGMFTLDHHFSFPLLELFLR